MRGLLTSIAARKGRVAALGRRKQLARRDGFVLIEALAAFAILTIALATLMTGLFGAVRNDDRAVFMMRATRTARSQLDALGIASAPVPGVVEGSTEDGLTYAVTVSFIVSPPSANLSAPKIRAFQAHIDVTRRGDVTGQALTLGFDTVKIVAIDEGRP